MLKTLQPSILDLTYLITDQPTAHHIAAQLGQCVGRYWFALGRAQAVKTFGGLLQLGIESADAEPGQRRLHSVDDPTLLSDEALALAVGPFSIFVFGCRDCHHLAVIPFAAQPAEKSTFKQLGIEPVCLGPPVLARYGDARCVNDVGLDCRAPAASAPARSHHGLPRRPQRCVRSCI